MRNLDSFDEFTLGKMKVWAEKYDAMMLISLDRTVVQIIQPKGTILYWKYGHDMRFMFGGKYMTLAGITDMLQELSESIGGTLADALQKLIDNFNQSDFEDDSL